MTHPHTVQYNGKTWEVRDWNPKGAQVLIRYRYSDDKGDHSTIWVDRKKVSA